MNAGVGVVAATPGFSLLCVIVAADPGTPPLMRMCYSSQACALLSAYLTGHGSAAAVNSRTVQPGHNPVFWKPGLEHDRPQTQRVRSSLGWDGKRAGRTGDCRHQVDQRLGEFAHSL